MKIRLEKLPESLFPQFKKDLQEAFQKGAEDHFGKINGKIMPDSHIQHYMSQKGAVTYAALDENGQLVGGAMIMIHPDHHNELTMLYVKNDVSGKGIGYELWRQLEELFPETKKWETCTPYFDKRNIHFYINKCGFHAVEFFWKGHKETDSFDKDLPESEYFDYMFRFEKSMK